MGTVATFQKDETARLQDEIERLKALLAAKPLAGSSGVYIFSFDSGKVGLAAYKQALADWGAAWKSCGMEIPPALIPLPDGVVVDHLTYNGFGLFTLRVPDDTSTELAARWAQAWNIAWSSTETPAVPVVIMSKQFDLERLTARQLQEIGLMRIPDQLTGHG